MNVSDSQAAVCTRRPVHFLVRLVIWVTSLGVMATGLQACDSKPIPNQSQSESPVAPASSQPAAGADSGGKALLGDPVKPPGEYPFSAAAIANPERGMYHNPGGCDTHAYNPSTLRAYRNTQITLVLCVFYLKAFKASDISSGALGFFESQANAVRMAGLKMIVRFAYTESTAGDDAPLTVVKRHITQLTPYLRRNSDVITIVQAGFVGTWGEGHYSQNFGTGAGITSLQWRDRKDVVDAVLAAVPSTRMVQQRTIRMKTENYEPAPDPDPDHLNPVTAAEAFSGSARARLGHHNDCFRGNYNDQGTYDVPDVTVGDQKKYLADDTKYVPMGGETCESNPTYSDCVEAKDELRRFNWSYLSADQSPVSEAWTGVCRSDVERRLGYRLALLASTFPKTVPRGGTMAFAISVWNGGFAAPVNARPVTLILRNKATRREVKVPLRSDPRRWATGVASSIQLKVVISGTTLPGVYELLLSLPDAAPALATKPDYALQMANTNLWEASTGYNRLFKAITVTRY